MNTFKRKALTSAILAGLGVAGSAHAIYQDPNGTGQYLLYPYYTVNSVDGSAFNTYITVVNPTSLVKVVRFRAREGRTSTEVRDFNIYLSPNDMWTAAIIPTTAGGAAVVTTDRSCTSPRLDPYPPGSSGTDLKGIDFTNILYTTGGAEFVAGYGTDNTRLREGYIEIIELATVDPLDPMGALTVHDPATDTPPCGAALLQATAATLPAIQAVSFPPTGGLNGTGTLVHVATGQTAGYNAVALANWTAFNQFGLIANDVPNLGNSDPFSIVVGTNAINVVPPPPPGPAGTFNATGPVTVYRSTWPATIVGAAQAASATMTHANVINEFGLDTATRSNTDWVLTFPTKRLLLQFPPGTAVPTAPFTNKYVATAGACEAISFTFFNREERGAPVTPGGFSPGGSTAAGPGSVCWESTVISIRNGAAHTPASGSLVSGVLGSNNVTGIDITTGIQNGWGNLSFIGTNATLGFSPLAGENAVIPEAGPAAFVAAVPVFRGLPVIGFMVRTLQNTAIACGTVGCKFGGLFPHKYLNNNTP